MKIFKFKKRQLLCDGRTRLMGILNVTPDSFSDGGQYLDPHLALARAKQLLADGAEIIDIGGESTRPGAAPVGVREEMKRVVPVISDLRKLNPECIISVDTSKPAVAAEALAAGADIINDVRGLRPTPDLARLAAATGAGLVIMHSRATPATMQNRNHLRYRRLLEEIGAFLAQALATAVRNGVDPEQIILDPGVGFAKNTGQNLEILGNIRFFYHCGRPLLAGPSRKAFIGELLGEESPEKRLWGTAGAVAWLAMNHLDFVRVHDAGEMRQVISVVGRLLAANRPQPVAAGEPEPRPAGRRTVLKPSEKND
jgi:dihydropteroate synthase